MRVLKISKVNIFLGSIIIMIILLCCSSQVQADQDRNYTYTVTAGQVQITGYTGAGGDVTIPSTLGGHPVTSIGNLAFYNCNNITSINIPPGVSSIGDQSFSGCTGLTSISIPQGLTSIGVSAFYDCMGLTTINLPQGLTSIGDAAFYNCTGLTTINLLQGLTSIGNAAFYDCTGLTSFSIPQGLTSIGDSTFYGCTGLTSISIPQGLTSIGDSTFYGCTGLTSISLPQEVTSIGSSAFYGCSGLTNISIPQGITSIGNGTFAYCTDLTSISIPQEITSIGGSAFFYCTGLTSINIPQGVTSIGDSAFAWCTGLTSISIPQGVISIGEYTFAWCTGLKSIVIPQRVTSIGGWAFWGCTGLTTITINSATTMISDTYSAITIPAETKIIGYDPSNAKDYATKYNNPFETIKTVSVPVTILAGSNSYETSLVIAKQFVKEEGRLNNLVIASGGNWPDALSGSPLAGAVNSPMLMVPTNISDATEQLDFITNNVNGGGTIYLLGGTSVVSTDYENTLTSKGFVVKRLGGYDAVDTSVLVASELAKLKPITGVCIVGNASYVDAVSISSYANKAGLPILITNWHSTKDTVVNFIKNESSTIKNVYVIGGTLVVGEEIVPAISPVLKDGSSSIIQRLWGNDMYDTNNVVQSTLAQDATKLAISSSDDYISSMSGAVYAGHKNTFLMIVPPSNLAKGNINTLTGMAPQIQDITIFGTIKPKSELLNYLQ